MYWLNGYDFEKSTPKMSEYLIYIFDNIQRLMICINVLNQFTQSMIVLFIKIDDDTMEVCNDKVISINYDNKTKTPEKPFRRFFSLFWI